MEQCSEQLRQLFLYLPETALHAGGVVTARPSVPQTGWGITFYAGQEWFCQIHPKAEANHLQVLVRGAAAHDLESAGFKPAERADNQPWVRVRTMRECVRMVPFIVDARRSGT
jgi:hypothetical protein